ncbi:hypothetical protein BEN47_08440 [Hymenobacter lapidarius]|uniref:Uncharacterized protein n=1 Tax=Hymenobacter lapidarius TaxID=1908237 RepID=A0A1G1TD08_9BACT|nr:hypothetical protein BEN47_08440 [Hymenobacter lapidarius]
MQITGILVASMISLGTFVMNTLNTNANSKSIESLKTQVDYLKREFEDQTLKLESEIHLTEKRKNIR